MQALPGGGTARDTNPMLRLRVGQQTGDHGHPAKGHRGLPLLGLETSGKSAAFHRTHVRSGRRDHCGKETTGVQHAPCIVAEDTGPPGAQPRKLFCLQIEMPVASGRGPPWPHAPHPPFPPSASVFISTKWH